jgi:hypothetical protein
MEELIGRERADWIAKIAKPTGIETMKGPAESGEICSGGVEEK